MTQSLESESMESHHKWRKERWDGEELFRGGKSFEAQEKVVERKQSASHGGGPSSASHCDQGHLRGED